MNKSEKNRTSSQQSGNWISSSFENFNLLHEEGLQKRKTKRKTESIASNKDQLQRESISDGDVLSWIDKYKPRSENDLAVRKNKIVELKSWLDQQLSCNSINHAGTGILLLSGPAGSGKTASIEILAKVLQYELKEWINPIGQDYQEKNSGNWRDFLTFQESQTQQFSDFLLRANRYNTLHLIGQSLHENTRKVVVVEDLPNFILHDPKKFHSVLRSYKMTSRSPLVIVMSDSNTNDSSIHTILPKQIQQELSIVNISLSAVAATSLKKLMSTIVSEELKDQVIGLLVKPVKCMRLQCRSLYRIDTKLQSSCGGSSSGSNIIEPTKEVYEMLASSCNGDIRSCINSLQFYCTNSNPSTKSSKSSSAMSAKRKRPTVIKRKEKRQSDDDGKIACVGGGPLKNSAQNLQLPTHLQSFTREPLLIDPEDIYERAQLTSDTLLLYLHQNYPDFYKEIDDVAVASSYVTDADILSGLWSTRHLMESHSASLAMRGIMYSNSRSFSGKCSAVGWRPLHKPLFFESCKTTNLRQRSVNNLFKETCHPAEDLYVEVLPYMAKINSGYKTLGHKSIVEELSTFNQNKHQKSHLQGMSDCCEGPLERHSNCHESNELETFNLGDSTPNEEDELIEDFDDE